MSDAVRNTIIAGAFGLLGTIFGAGVTGWSQVQLAKQKFYSDLVLKALEPSAPDQRLESLRFLVDTKLINDAAIQEGVKSYAEARKSNPETIPQVAPVNPSALGAPIVSGARVYLLAGHPSKEHLFPTYTAELEAAGFKVLNAKIMSDEGRPNHPEVRYFYSQDADQAQKLAEFMRFRLSDASTEAKLYQDKRVQPGYVEIWFGNQADAGASPQPTGRASVAPRRPG